MYGPVLVLNANFEPINVCDTPRALGLILMGRATLIINGRGEVKTVSATYPAPSVIRLNRMIRRPRAVVRLTKREVFRRDDYTCQYCGQHTTRPTIDHVVPKHLGGTHSWNNLVTACPSCNHRKGGRTPEQAQMLLRRQPGLPPTSAEYIFGRYLTAHSEWLPYVHGW